MTTKVTALPATNLPANAEQVLPIQDKTALIAANWNFNYPGARSWCRDRGGELMTLETPEEQALVQAEMIKFTDRFWIGLLAKDEKPTTDKYDFRWLTTGRGPDPLTFRWSDNEPNNAEGFEGVCVELWLLWSSSEGNDLDCEYRQPFVCQLGKWHGTLQLRRDRKTNCMLCTIHVYCTGGGGVGFKGCDKLLAHSIQLATMHDDIMQ